VAVESGLALVRYGALTLEQFVHKVSTAGAAMLGLPAKGHLGESADADITVLDTRQAKPVMTIVGGKIVMAHGVIYGRRGTIICTKQGIEAPKSVGLDYQTIDVSDTLLYTK
jgi:formylmethanofuran dehydrogenase subunit A